MYELESRIQLCAPLDEVFTFFADATNLERLTPSWLTFQVLTPQPIVMEVGARIDYRLRLHGLPIRWKSEITTWDPPVRFVDTQIQGPYRTWVHEHLFEQIDGHTHVVDRVLYDAPLGWLTNRLLVAPDLRKIFSYRQEILGGRFERMAGAATALLTIREADQTGVTP